MILFINLEKNPSFFISVIELTSSTKSFNPLFFSLVNFSETSIFSLETVEFSATTTFLGWFKGLLESSDSPSPWILLALSNILLIHF